MSSSPSSPTFTEQARRAQIIQAAITTVNEIGYPRASLAEIARRAGIAKSAIVYYFESKDGLLLSVVDHVFTEVDAMLADAVPAGTGPAEQLRAYAEAYLQYVATHRAEIAAGVEIVVSHRGADGVLLYLTGTDEDSPLLRRILDDGMKQGAFRTMPLAVAVTIVESVLDVATTELQRDLAADLEPLLPELVTTVLRGLAAELS